MITISHNEVIVACRKAFEAMGFATGQAEDAAEAIGWLAVHGVPWAHDFLPRAKSIRPDIRPLTPTSADKDGSVWDGQNLSAVANFPNLVDYACVRAKRSGKHFLTLHNCSDIDMIWPYLAKAHARGFSALMRYTTSLHIESTVIFDNSKSYPDFMFQFDGSTREFWDVELTISDRPICREEIILQVMIQPIWSDQFKSNYERATKNGIEMPEDIWTWLTETGKGILVESTEESEKRGAGGV